MATRFAKEYREQAERESKALIKLAINKGFLSSSECPDAFRNMKEVSLEGAIGKEKLKKAVALFHAILSSESEKEP